MDDDWMTALRAAEDTLRPTPAAATAVRDGVRRARRRRTTGIAVIAVAGVAAVAIGVVMVPRSFSDRQELPSANDSTSPAGAGFSCPREHRVFTDDPPTSNPMSRSELQPVESEVRRRIRGLSGRGAFAYWPEAGAFVVDWKEPVPPEIENLENLSFPNGAVVIVDGVKYSAADVRRAQNSLFDWLEQTDHRADWSSSTACGDYSGLVVAFRPGFVRHANITSLQNSIYQAVGMPVMIVAEEPPVAL